MTSYPITKLGSIGINIDVTPSLLNKAALTYANNVRLDNGGIMPFYGASEMAELSATSIPYNLIDIGSSIARYWIITCNDDILYYSGLVTSVKPTGFTSVSDGRLWSVTSLPEIPIINHPDVGPLYKTDNIAEFTDLPYKPGETWADNNQSCEIIVSHKQFLWGLKITDNGEYRPDAIRWSSVADIGGVPATWDHLDTTNVAGYTALGGSGGAIIGAVPMMDALVFYRRKGITIADYIGGTYIWRFRHLESDAGLIARDAVVDVNGIHYFLSDGDIYSNDGTSVKSIADDKITTFLESIDNTIYGESYAVHNVKDKEVLFVIPTSGEDYPNLCLVYKYDDDAWTTRDMPYHYKAKYGLVSTKSNAWDDDSDAWDTDNTTWDSGVTTPFDNSVIAITQPSGSESAKLLDLSSNTPLNEAVSRSIIERTDLLLGDETTVRSVNRMYIHAEGVDTLNVQLGSQLYPGGPITWKTPVQFTPGADRKVDIRSTGIYHSYRIYVDNPSGFKVSSITFEFVEDGTR